MRNKKTQSLLIFLLAMLAVLSLLSLPTPAQKREKKILIHDGLVMSGPVHVYLIWYGNWGTNSARTILVDLVSHLGGTPYQAINTSYFDSTGSPLSEAWLFGGAFEDAYSRGTFLTNSDVRLIVLNAITSISLPSDPNGIYIVLPSADVTVEGVCTDACEFHDWIPRPNPSQNEIKYAVVGNADRCPTQCIPLVNRQISPNDNPGADAMATWLAHVVSGTVTNPTGSGWFDKAGNENSDKCEFRFGDTYLTANGSRANIRLGGRDYLLQQNWVNDKFGFCALTYP